QELAVVNFNRFRQETSFQGGEVVRIWDVQENVIRTTLGPDLLQAFVGQRDGEWYAALRSREEDTVRVVRVMARRCSRSRRLTWSISWERLERATTDGCTQPLTRWSMRHPLSNCCWRPFG